MRKKWKIISALVLCTVCILLMSMPVFAKTTEDADYIVLVLDISGTETFTVEGQVIYEADTAISDVKKAAGTFFDRLKNAPGEYRVAIVAYDDEARTVLDFTTDIDQMKQAVNGLQTGGRDRSIAEGLAAAGLMLTELPEDANKSVILYTTGMTDCGSYNYEGHYDENTTGSSWVSSGTDVNLYAYANTAYDTASIVKQYGNLYAIGLFQTMEGMPADGQDIAYFFRQTVEDLSSSHEYAFEAERPDQIADLFAAIAGRITGVGDTDVPDMKEKKPGPSPWLVFLIILIAAGAVIGLIALTRADKRSMDDFNKAKRSFSEKLRNLKK